ncbi:hypothetical protein Leryth_022482 [Lithospermum erythrorhizon]|nr:hypothetical protein Leryth_022482 [Lithospermum erythrorhizon]
MKPRRKLGNGTRQMDLFYGVEYDTVSGNVRPLKFDFDPWCSSGGLSPNGALVSTGGDNAGARAVRILDNCNTCEVKEKPLALASNRWYASQQILQDGRIAVVGGRRSQNYEIISSNDLNFQGAPFALLIETSDEVENNLYPFVNLLPDGNLFIFANTKSVIINPESGETVHTFPELQGGSRNYPSSGMSAMLPLKLTPESTEDNVEAEVLVCGGNTNDAFKVSNVEPRQFYNAHNDCGRIKVTARDSEWEKEDMPSGRVMGDMLLLPTGDILILNGAKKGTSGWHCADEPNLTPVLYNPDKNNGERFTELQAATIPRMYHSASAVLPDGEILVAGSNTNPTYDFNAKFPTELRVEKFTPPYLAPELQKYRAEIQENQSDKALNYGKLFKVYIKIEGDVKKEDIKITMLPPPFTTHGYSQNQRLVVLGLTEVKKEVITAMAPPSGKIAPPGYYMLFVVHHGVPSKAMWVKL